MEATSLPLGGGQGVKSRHTWCYIFMRLNICVLPGDGIGPEVTREAVRVLRYVAEAQGYDFRFTERAIGASALRQFDSPLPPATIETCKKSHAVLLGAVGSPEFERIHPASAPEAGLLGLRKALGGFANLRPAIAYPPIANCSPLRPEVPPSGHSFRPRIAWRTLLRRTSWLRRQARLGVQHHALQRGRN